MKQPPKTHCRPEDGSIIFLRNVATKLYTPQCKNPSNISNAISENIITLNSSVFTLNNILILNTNMATEDL